jgi:hypothetical protein
MKTLRYTLLIGMFSFMLSSCSLFKPKYGCGTNGGRNVGAEKVLEQDPKKVKKFKA